MLGLHQRTTTRYLETKDDRKAIQKADDKEFGPRAIKAKGDPEIEVPPLKVNVEDEPEFASIETFAEFCFDDEQTQFSFESLQKLSATLRCSPGKVIKELATYGLKYAGRPHERVIRGFTSNSHNLYAGNPMCGGSGFESNGVGSTYRR